MSEIKCSRNVFDNSCRPNSILVKFMAWFFNSVLGVSYSVELLNAGWLTPGTGHTACFLTDSKVCLWSWEGFKSTWKSNCDQQLALCPEFSDRIDISLRISWNISNFFEKIETDLTDLWILSIKSAYGSIQWISKGESSNTTGIRKCLLRVEWH